MSSKPREQRRVEQRRVEQRRVEPRAMSAMQAEAAETNTADSAQHQKIRFRAYEIYLERGEQSGGDLDDWFQAERELTTNHNGG